MFLRSIRCIPFAGLGGGEVGTGSLALITWFFVPWHTVIGDFFDPYSSAEFAFISDVPQHLFRRFKAGAEDGVFPFDPIHVFTNTMNNFYVLC